MLRRPSLSTTVNANRPFLNDEIAANIQVRIKRPTCSCCAAAAAIALAEAAHTSIQFEFSLASCATTRVCMAFCSALHATSATRFAMNISMGVQTGTLNKSSGETAAMERNASHACVRLTQDPLEPRARSWEMVTHTYPSLKLHTHAHTHDHT
jgi:hypothetical protein